MSDGARQAAIRATVMPSHTNPYGGVFGGWIISQMALGAGSEASRHVAGKAVLVAADELRLTGAPRVGDELTVFVELEQRGRTSLTYAAEAVARERHGEARRTVATGRFKFVALDGDDRPREIAGQEEDHG